MAFTSIVVIAVAIGAVCGGRLHPSRSMGPSSGSRIINGEQASPGEFPHQVSLLKDGYHMCGGSIIANGWAITASHCVDGQTTSSLAVVVDLHSLSNPGSNYIVLTVSQVIMSGSGSSVLLKADVTALKTQCQDYWGTANILDQHLCAKGYDTTSGSGSCNGDSGGPLVCEGKLAGVTSWGRSGCHVDGVVTHPSVYAKTAFFRDWVKTSCGNCIA